MDSHTNKSPEGYFLNCVDPGGDTGMSLLHIRPDSFRLLECATVRWRPRHGENPVATLIQWREEHPGVHHLLYEDFHLRNTKEAASTDTTPLLVIGAIEQMIFERSPYEQTFAQEPVAAKHIATDDKLERLGLHLGHTHAQLHVRDANRHAGAHLTRRRSLPVRQAAFPRQRPRPGPHRGSAAPPASAPPG